MAYTWQYYDVVLAAIGLAIVVGVVVGLATSVALTLSVSAFSVLAIAVLVHGLFVRGPVDDPEDLAEAVEALN